MQRFRDQSVQSAVQTIVPPYSSKLVPVHTAFSPGKETVLVEQTLHTNKGPEEMYSVAESFIHTDNPSLYVANFSSVPITIGLGQILGTARNPHDHLDKSEDYTPEEHDNINRHTNLVRAFIQIDSQLSLASIDSIDQVNLQENELGSGDSIVKGGPKTAETPTDSFDELKELDICKDLSKEERSQLQSLLRKQKQAFGIDGRLGKISGEVEVPLKEGTKPISIPPFVASPENQLVIDKQMDAWLKLDIIEPSKIPWGAPVFIVYRNKKPRMVIDL